MGRTGGVIKYSIPFALLLIIIALASPALGSPDPGSVHCPASADAHVHSAASGGNFGGNALLRTGYCCGEFPGNTFIYIKFDLSSIPATSTVTGATLGLYLDSGMGFPAGMDLKASRVTGSWGEFSITWNNKPGWSGVLDTTSVGTAPGWYEWNIPAIVVREWMENPGENHGIIIHWSGEVHPDQFSRDFHSRVLGNHPLLRVDYEMPATTTTPTPSDWTPTTTTAAVTTTLTWPAPITDNIDPVVELIEAPTEGWADSTVRIVAEATDNQELALVQIWVGGVLEQSCMTTGPDGSTMECVFDGPLEQGNHAYWALAYDLAGNGDSSEIVYLQVYGAGTAPEIDVNWLISRPSGHPTPHLYEPCACDLVTFMVVIESEDLSDVDLVTFQYDTHMETLYPSIAPGVEQWTFYVEDYPVPVGADSIYYRAHVHDTEGFFDTESGYINIDTSSNALQDAGEGGIDCGGSSPSVCDDCLNDYSYPEYNIGFDGIFSTHFNFPNDGELELAQSLAWDALQEYSAHAGIWLYNLDTADEYMEAVAYYVDQHMNYVGDTNSSLGWDGGQTFWRTATQSAARGCGNDFCGDCEDYAILRMTLLLALGVSDDCVYIVLGPGHAYNIVNYQNKFRYMDYGELGAYFYSTTHWDAHETYGVGRTGGWTGDWDNGEIYIPMNYPGVRGCPTGYEYSWFTYYCDVCP